MTWISGDWMFEHGERRHRLPEPTAPAMTPDCPACGEPLDRPVTSRSRCRTCDRLYDLTGPTPVLVAERPWDAPPHPRREDR